ncbi:MAG: hypothetical protein GYB68_10375, partial [Chloroflexi bacterium]|nr:hypothetical protein [Chloroflexota bacterium]
GNGEQLRITYNFKDDIVWSDGEPFTTDDIRFTDEVVLDPDSGAVTRRTPENAEYVYIDDYTLQVTLAPGLVDPLYFLPPYSSVHGGGGAPLPEHILGDMTPAEILESDYTRLPNPTLGAYQYVEWVEGDRIVLEAVPGHSNGEARTPNVIYRFIADTNQLLASTLSGECDYATSDGLQLTQVPFIQQSADQGLINYFGIPSVVWEHIDFNSWPNQPGTQRDGTPFFADVRVRQAVAYGTNRLEMTEQILYGEVQPLTSYLPSDHWAWNSETADDYPYDPDTARELLAEAGWEDADGNGVVEAVSQIDGVYSCERGDWSIPAGTEFEVDFHTTTGNAMREQLSTLFQANMADIGLRVNLDLLPASVWFGSDGPLFQRTYQIGEFAWVSDPDPTSFSIFGGINIYETPFEGEEQFLDAASILAREDVDRDAFLAEVANVGEGYADALDWFYFGRPATEDLPEGYRLVDNEQVQEARDNLEGQNNLGWCDSRATWLMWWSGNVLAPEDRLPYILEFQEIHSEQVPQVVLFQRLEVEAFAPNLCGPDKGPANYASWNVEDWYFADECE